MDMCDNAFHFMFKQQTWGLTRRCFNHNINNDSKKDNSRAYIVFAAQHISIHCTGSSTAFQHPPLSLAIAHLQQSTYSIPEQTHTNTHLKQTLPCLWHVTVQRVYAWRSPVQTIMIIKSRSEAVEVIVPRKS